MRDSGIACLHEGNRARPAKSLTSPAREIVSACNTSSIRDAMLGVSTLRTAPQADGGTGPGTRSYSSRSQKWACPDRAGHRGRAIDVGMSGTCSLALIEASWDLDGQVRRAQHPQARNDMDTSVVSRSQAVALSWPLPRTGLDTQSNVPVGCGGHLRAGLAGKMSTMALLFPDISGQQRPLHERSRSGQVQAVDCRSRASRCGDVRSVFRPGKLSRSST